MLEGTTVYLTQRRTPIAKRSQTSGPLIVPGNSAEVIRLRPSRLHSGLHLVGPEGDTQRVDIESPQFVETATAIFGTVALAPKLTAG